MRRHESLIPLSRFHRSVLFVAQMAKRNGPQFKGYPTDIEGKARYAVEFFADKLQAHFQLEETKLLPVIKGKDTELDAIISEIEAEHVHLTHLFEGLKSPSDTESQLDELGFALEAHVRKEERVLFQKIQVVLTESELQQLVL